MLFGGLGLRGVLVGWVQDLDGGRWIDFARTLVSLDKALEAHLGLGDAAADGALGDRVARAKMTLQGQRWEREAALVIGMLAVGDVRSVAEHIAHRVLLLVLVVGVAGGCEAAWPARQRGCESEREPLLECDGILWAMRCLVRKSRFRQCGLKSTSASHPILILPPKWCSCAALWRWCHVGI
jgi:hypothetical protein